MTDPSYVSVLQAWARAEARIQLLERWFADKGLLQEDGTPRPGVDLLLRCESQASKLRSRLGLDPVSRAALQKDLADAGRSRVDMSQALSEGRRLRLAAEARMASAQPLPETASEALTAPQSPQDLSGGASVPEAAQEAPDTQSQEGENAS